MFSKKKSFQTFLWNEFSGFLGENVHVQSVAVLCTFKAEGCLYTYIHIYIYIYTYSHGQKYRQPW